MPFPRTTVGQISTATAYLAGNGHASTGTCTFPVTITAGTNALEIDISAQDSNDANLPITGVTVNGSAVGVVKAIETKDGSNDTLASCWYLLNPTPGTYNVAVTSTGNVFKGCVATGLKGVIAQAPSAIATGQTGSAASVSQAITVAAPYSMIVAGTSHKGTYVSISQGQTLIANEDGQSFEHCTVSVKEANAGATTMGQQWGSSNSYSSNAVAWTPTVNVVLRTVATIGSRTVVTTPRTIATI